MAKPPPKRHATAGTRKGHGTGYGGRAKGAGSDAPMQPPFEPGNTSAAGPHDNTTGAEQRAEMLAIITEIAKDKNQPGMARISAADKWLDRYEGKPLARNLNINTDDLADLDDDALAARRAGLERALRADVGGTEAPPDPQGRAGLVH